MARDEAYREAERRIEEALRSGATELDLRNLGLTELPESIGRLANLQKLALGSYPVRAKRNQLTTLPDTLSQLTQLQSLNLSGNRLVALPEWLGQLAQLQELNLSGNQLTSLPESISNLIQLKMLWLYDNHLKSLPEALRRLTKIEIISINKNLLRILPEWIGEFKNIRHLAIGNNELTGLPKSLGELEQIDALFIQENKFKELPEEIFKLTKLQRLNLNNLKLSDLPTSFLQLEHLIELHLDDNPLNPELAAAYKEGFKAVKAYLRAKATAQIVLNEAKLILVGEGEVGKSCLLGALRDDPWQEGLSTTHGIEIKPVVVTDEGGREITLNGWDFGGQRVYRPTHQLFFSAPAVYLVVWKPREGPQQGFVKEWIKLIKHREPEARILVVATHGGPGARQPDIDRQELRDLFGAETVIDFFHVESKPDAKGRRRGIAELRQAIAGVAAGLPEMGRTVPERWQATRAALEQSGAAYLSLEQVFDRCRAHGMAKDEADLFVTISHRLGHLIHYEHDPALRDIVVLKPDWLATAISFVLDDEATRGNHGMVSFGRLRQLWDDPARAPDLRYPADLHPIFLRLMERFDLSYRVAGMPVHSPEDETSLIAQLVPDNRPEPIPVWAEGAAPGDTQQVQICRIVDAQNGQSASAEGLFYQLIVRLHKFSLGRVNYTQSVHWQRGLVLDDDYSGRALLEHVGNDVRITVRAPYPERFLSVLTSEVKYLVDSFWTGLRCDVMVPCVAPCGSSAPGTGLFEVQKLIASKRGGRPEYPCPVCNEWQHIDSLLRNAPAAQPVAAATLFAEFAEMKQTLDVIYQKIRQQDAGQRNGDGQQVGGQLRDAELRQLLDEHFNASELQNLCFDLGIDYERLAGPSKSDKARELIGYVRRHRRIADLQAECQRLRPTITWFAAPPSSASLPAAMRRFERLEPADQRILSKVDAAYASLIQALSDEGKEGPRLFSLVPVNRTDLDPEHWTRETFRLILWCEHSRLPLPLINTKAGRSRGVYEIALTRDWFARAAPFLSTLSNTLSLVLPVALSKEKLAFGETAYKQLVSYFDSGRALIDATPSGGEQIGIEHGGMIRSQGATLRDLHALLKAKDPGLGGLVRVRNKRQEFLWVHPQFEGEY